MKENQFFTVMAVFEVDPQQQQQLIDGLATQVERYVKKFPGFVSANFHASDDGKRVVNYAQWLSNASWQGAAYAVDSDKAKKGINAVIKRCGAKSVTGDSFSFRVVRIVEGA